MKLSIVPKGFVFSLLLFAGAALAQSVDNRDEDRQQLLSLLGKIEVALNNKNVAEIKKHIHSQAIITFHDAKVAQGPEALEAYFNDKLGGASAVLKSFSTKSQVDAPAAFYDNIAVAYGHSVDEFVFATGTEFQLTSRWTVTLRKDSDSWVVIALHFSTNMFDNPLLNAAKNKLIAFSIIAFLVGMLLMFVLLRVFFSRK